jgi:hypothetical protein
MRSGFMPFVYIEDKPEITTVTEPISKNYLNELVILLNEILDPNIPFLEKI